MTKAQLRKRRIQAQDLTKSKMDQRDLSIACNRLRDLDGIIEKLDFSKLNQQETRFLMKLKTEFWWKVQNFWDEAHREVIIDLLVSLDETRAELKQLKNTTK